MISIPMRGSRIGRSLPALVLLVASGQRSIADERILVNVFNRDHSYRDIMLARLGSPQAIDVTPNGDIFLLGLENHVWRYKPDGTADISIYHARPLDGLRDVAVDGLGTVSISNEVKALDEVHIERVGIGPHDPIVLPYDSVSSTRHSLHLSVDGSNNVYLELDRPGDTPSGNPQILKYSPSEDFMGAVEVLPPENGNLPQLVGMDVTEAGSIYVADAINNRAGRLQTIGFVGVIVPFTAAGELSSLFDIAFDQRRDQVWVATRAPQPMSSSTVIHRFNANDGSLVNSFLIEGLVTSLDVDVFGSMYAITDTPRNLIGIDPTITGSELTAAAQLVVLAGKSFDESEEGAYLRGLAVRAARTQNNLRSISEAKAALSQLRPRANFDVDPQLSDPMSIAIEQINGFLTAVEANSPLIVGEGSIVLETPAPPPDPPNEFAAFINGLLGEEPFYGRYQSAEPIGFPPPTHVELTIDPATATSNFVKPRIWGSRDLVRPEVISSSISLDFNGLVPTVNEFSMVLGSMDIDGTPSGLNRGRLSPSGQLHSQFGRQGRDFEAHVEGWITNDLYTDSRPIFTFLDLQGFRPSNSPEDVTVYGTNEPVIVPGLPGEPPTNLAGIGFVATRAAFNQATGTLVFHENTDPSKTPDLSVILTPDGVFAHGVGTGEPAVGAGFSITPLVFTGFDATSGRYEFADAALTITGESAPFGTALLTDIGIDPQTLSFTGALEFSLPLLRTDSPFVNTLRNGPAKILLLTPGGTLELLTRTANFTRSAMTQTDFIVLGVVPEPGALALSAAALSAALAIRHRRAL